MDRTKFCIHIIIDKVYDGVVKHYLLVLLNIWRMNGQKLIKFCIHIIIDKIYVGFVIRHLIFQTELCP